MVQRAAKDKALVQRQSHLRFVVPSLGLRIYIYCLPRALHKGNFPLAAAQE